MEFGIEKCAKICSKRGNNIRKKYYYKVRKVLRINLTRKTAIKPNCNSSITELFWNH